MTRRLRPVPVALGCLAVVLASCGGQQFPQSLATPTTVRPAAADPAATHDPRAVLLSSVQRTSALKTARVALSMSIDGVSGESMTVSGSGVFDFVAKEFSLSMSGDANGESLSIEERLVGGMVYTRTDGHWNSARVNTSDLNTPNPASYLSYLQGISSDVHVDGHETLRGVDTTRYVGNIDFDRALTQASSPAQRKAFAQALTLFGGMKMPMTAWIDGEGHVRKLQLSLDLAPALRLAGAPVDGDPKMVVALELYDFGVPVHVVAPS